VEEELVDEEAVLIAQLGLHAGAFDAHRLVEHGDNEERCDDGDADIARPDAVARMEQAAKEAETGMEHGRLGSSFNFILRSSSRFRFRKSEKQVRHLGLAGLAAA
jgi:hypothetical protein